MGNLYLQLFFRSDLNFRKYKALKSHGSAIFVAANVLFPILVSYWPDMIILSNHIFSYPYPPRWSGQMRNLQYSNCACPLRSAEIMKLSGARRDNPCETNYPYYSSCYKNNPNCDCLIDASGKNQCDCKDKSCRPGQYSTDKNLEIGVLTKLIVNARIRDNVLLKKNFLHI